MKRDTGLGPATSSWESWQKTPKTLGNSRICTTKHGLAGRSRPNVAAQARENGWRSCRRRPSGHARALRRLMPFSGGLCSAPRKLLLYEPGRDYLGVHGLPPIGCLLRGHQQPALSPHAHKLTILAGMHNVAYRLHQCFRRLAKRRCLGYSSRFAAS